MNLIKKLTSLLIIGIISLTLVSCGKEPEFLRYNFTPEPTVAPIATEVPDGTTEIRIAMPSEIESTNPFKVTSRDMMSIYNLIFEPLISFDDTGEPVPVLAQTWELDIGSGRKWTITLRDDVYWQQSGRKIDAYDVEFTLDLMNSLRREGNGDYCEELGYIKYWSVEDERTINIYSYEPFYGMINALDFPILPKDVNYTLTTEPTYPIGTGPYMVSSWFPGESIVLTRNENWWQQKPSIGKIIAEPYDDNSLAVSAFQLSQLDVVQTGKLALSATDQVMDTFSYEYTTRYFEFLAPNLNSTYLSDKRVRQAIAYALDREEIISNVYINHAIAVDTPVPPTSFLFSGTLLTYNNNIAEAKSLLRIAGWRYLNEDDVWLGVSPEGSEINFTLTLLTNEDIGSPHRAEVASYIAKQLEQVGIKVEVKTENWENYKNMVQEGRFDLLLAGWYLNDIPDLRFAVKSDGSQNVTGYNDLEMDELLHEVMQSKTRETISASFERVQQKIIEDLPIISLYFRTHTLLTRKNITNVIQVREESAFSSIQYWEIK